MRRISVLCMCVFILLYTCGCASSDNISSRSGFYFDTIISISLYDCENSEELLKEAFELCGQLEQTLSKSAQGSDVWRVNHANGTPVSVSDVTAYLIDIAESYYNLSGGLFDITCGAETALWDFHAAEPSIPSEAQRAEAVNLTGFTAMQRLGNTVILPPGMQLELGGIAKGYIADRLRVLLTARGAENAIINLGGNVVTIGDNSGGMWRIGVKSPFSDTGYSCIINVGARSVVTSGIYERCFEADGVTYHHILDPRTAMPADTDIAGVTIISESSVDGDALSTVCLLLGSEKAAELIYQTDNTEAVIILRDGSIISTDPSVISAD